MRVSTRTDRPRSIAATCVTVLMGATMVIFPRASFALATNITLASASASGANANQASFLASVSANGNRVAFHTAATNLDVADTNPGTDVYVKDLGGSILFASSKSDGSAANGSSSLPSLSTFGTKVAFQSTATTLVAADGDTVSDVFVKDLGSGAVTLVSASDNGTKGNGTSTQASLSPDGSLVAFVSLSTNLDPADNDAVADVYVKDLSTGNLSLASTSDTGVKGSGASSGPSITWNGAGLAFDTKVAFHSTAANLDPGDADTSFDVFVKNLETGDISIASTSDSGVNGNGVSVEPSIDHVGNVVAFASSATNVDPLKTDSILDVFAKDLGSGGLTLVSVSTGGGKGNSDSQVPSVSDDGNEIAFHSMATNLDSGFSPTSRNVFVRNVSSGETRLVSTRDDGTIGNAGTFDPSIAANGTAVAFDSDVQDLEQGDGDGNADVFVKELSTPPPPCEAGGCGGGTTDSDAQTTTVTVPEEEGVISIAVAQSTVDFGSVQPDDLSSDVGVGDILYENTLGTNQPWGATVASTSLSDPSGEHVSFTNISFTPGTTITPDTPTINAGSGGAFSGPDPNPGTSFSSSRTVLLAGSADQGSFVQSGGIARVGVPPDAVFGSYSGTFQYTVTG